MPSIPDQIAALTTRVTDLENIVKIMLEKLNTIEPHADHVGAIPATQMENWRKEQGPS